MDDLLFFLYRGLVADALEKAGYKQCPWKFSEALDMSYDEIKHRPADSWAYIIERDLADYKRENLMDFK